MSASNTFSTDVLKLVLANIAASNIGDSSGLQPSATAGSLYISLHTADPGAAGSQTTSEAAYTGYARVAIARSGSSWTFGTGTASNASSVTFPAATAGSETETYFCVGTAATGTGEILFRVPLSSSVSIASGDTPSFSAGSLTITAS